MGDNATPTASIDLVAALSPCRRGFSKRGYSSGQMYLFFLSRPMWSMSHRLSGLRCLHLPYRHCVRGNVARGEALGERKAEAQGETQKALWLAFVARCGETPCS